MSHLLHSKEELVPAWLPLGSARRPLQPVSSQSPSPVVVTRLSASPLFGSSRVYTHTRYGYFLDCLLPGDIVGDSDRMSLRLTPGGAPGAGTPIWRASSGFAYIRHEQERDVRSGSSLGLQ